MNIVTKYPVLVNPARANVNDYRLNEPSQELPGAVQKVAVGDFVIKGTNPVFDNDKEVTQNEFMYLKPIDADGETLTPMDEYMYSGRNYSDGKYDFGEFVNWGDVFENADGVLPAGATRKSPKDRFANVTGEELLGNPYSKPKTNPLQGKTISPSQFTSTIKDVPGGPTAAEQLDKAKKEGKFWNALKGSWDKFKTTDNGQIIVQSGMALLMSKLGGTGSTTTTTDTAPPTTPPADDKKPMTPMTKTLLIGGGVILLGIIIYSVAKSKK